MSKGRKLLIALSMGVVAIPVVLWITSGRSPDWRASTNVPRRERREASSSSQGELKIPPPIRSIFQNTRPDVAYVGSQVCSDCHSDSHASYSETPHSQALAEIDVQQEPPDAQVFHAASHIQIQNRESLAIAQITTIQSAKLNGRRS